MIEELLPILKQLTPVISIITASNIFAFIYIKVKNDNNKIEVMDVSRKLRKIDRINKANKESIF